MNNNDEQRLSSSPAHTSPAPCGKFVGSASAWPGSRSALPSCRRRCHRWPLQQPRRLQTRLLSLALPRPLLAACCPASSAVDLEAPPPGRHGYWALRRTRKGRWHKNRAGCLACVTSLFLSVNSTISQKLSMSIRRSMKDELCWKALLFMFLFESQDYIQKQ